MKVDNNVFESSCKFSYDSFMKFHRKNFDYIYDSRFKYDDWTGDCRVKGEGELNFTLYKDWSGKKISGSIQYRLSILKQRAALRRLLKPTTDATEIYLNLYEDVYGQEIFDNSDGKINRGLLKGIAEDVFKHDFEWIFKNYRESIDELTEYYNSHYSGNIMYKGVGVNAKQDKTNFRYNSVVNGYNWDETKKNNATHLGVSESYLTKHNIGTVEQKNMDKQYKGTKKGRTQDWKDRKKNGEVLSRLKFEDAKEMYPEMKGSTNIETIDNYKKAGYQVSEKTILKIKKELAKDIIKIEDMKKDENKETAIETPEVNDNCTAHKFEAPKFTVPTFTGFSQKKEEEPVENTTSEEISSDLGYGKVEFFKPNFGFGFGGNDNGNSWNW